MNPAIYIDLSADSEDETPPDRKRPRLEAAVSPYSRNSLAKLLPLPTTTTKVSQTPATTTTTAAATPAHIKPINIPSGITVTKRQCNNNNNNNNIAAGVSNGSSSKQVKSAVAQKVAWSMSSKVPTTTATITSVPSHAVKVTPINRTPLATPPQKPPLLGLQQKVAAPPLVQQKPVPALQQKQPPALIQRPALVPQQRTPTVATQQRPLPVLQKHTFHSQQQQQQQQQQQISVTMTNSNNAPPLAKLTPLSKSVYTPRALPATPTLTTAARTLPFKATSSSGVMKPAITKSTLATSTMHSMAAGATPPLRLLATPPHCAAALNEPLLLNLPPTTSITPQLTPTSTPPLLPLSTALQQQQQLAKAAALKLASISPVPKPKPAVATTTTTDVNRKRVQPITVLKKSDEAWRRHLAQQDKEKEQKPKTTPTPTIVLVESPPTTPPTEKVEKVDKVEKEKEKVEKLEKLEKSKEPAAIVPEYVALMQLSREVDPSKDMERLIEIKLLKYYHSVHENFVRSRGFRKLLQLAMERIKAEPDMIYIHLKGVVDELKVRRKAKAVPAVEEEEEVEATKSTTPQPIQTAEEKPSPVNNQPEIASTGNKRTDERIRKLNRTLYTITKRISALEQAEVDWNDDDDSSYLQVERYKKRACQVYEKICDLTGERKTAYRQLKQKILFKDTSYPQFNRTLTAFVNRMHEFPDFHDVLQLLEHCNKDKDLGLATFEMKRIAHDAFVKVGKLLQARRKTDLYETVTHFTANAKDPAASDPELLAKLNENNKKQSKISDVLDKYAREQDLTAEEQREARLKEKQLASSDASTSASPNNEDNDNLPSTSAQALAAQNAAASTNGLAKVELEVVADEVDDDDQDMDTEDEEDLDAFVESFKANGELSEAESEVEAEVVATPKTTTTANKTTKAEQADVIEIVETTIINNVTRAKTAAEQPKSVSLPNGKRKQSPPSSIAAANTTLKVMSVSSLNATVRGEQQVAKTKVKVKAKLIKAATAAIATATAKTVDAVEIVISDEES